MRVKEIQIFFLVTCVYLKIFLQHTGITFVVKKKLSFMRKNSPENLIKPFEIH